MSESYLRGLNAYAESSGAINQNWNEFSNENDSIKLANKSLTNAAKMKTDLNAMTGVAEEGAVKAFKGIAKKAGGWLDNRLTGGRIGKDTEGLNKFVKKKFGDAYDDFKGKVSDAGDDIGERASNLASDVSDRVGGASKDAMDAVKDLKTRATRAVRGGEEGDGSVEMTGETTETPQRGTEMNDTLETKVDDDDGNPVRRADMDDAGKSRYDGMETKDDDPPEKEEIGEEGEGDDMDFDSFMKQFSDDLPTTEGGDLDLPKAGDQMGMIEEDYRGKSMQQEGQSEASERDQMGQEDTQGAERSGEAGERNEMGMEDEDVGIDHPLDGNPSNKFSVTDDANDLTDTAESGAKDLGKDLGEDAGEDAVDSGIGDGLEGAGTLLDATGIGAIVGVPLQIAGAVLEGGALYEMGKGIWNWFDEDILGHQPKVNTTPLLKAPLSIAQKGMMITPNMDTLDTQPSYSSSW
tara:strand:- start:322 stop:1713 length:1392 start_codon:yes stop_codon:yes gene_type:complete